MFLKNSPNIFSLLIISFLLSCSSTKEEKQKDEQIIINNIVNYLQENNHLNLSENDFLISPHVGNYDFNNFSKNQYQGPGNYKAATKSEQKILGLLNYNREKFLAKQKENNKISYNEKRINYSSSEESKMIFVFSSLSDELIFLETFHMDKVYDREDLSKKTILSNRKQQVCSFSIILNKNEVNKVMVDNCINWL